MAAGKAPKEGCAREAGFLSAYVTVPEASEATGLTKSYVCQLIRSRRIEAEKIGRDWLIRRESLEDFYAQRKRRGRPRKSDA